MKILLTNEHAYRPGGSETAFYTLAIELIRRGHEVYIYATHKGTVSNTILKAGAKWIVPGHYDRVICSHITTQKHLFARQKAGVISWGHLTRVCHGAIPELEQPMRGADDYVAISQEVQAHLKKLGYSSTVILNGIDCERFSPFPDSHVITNRVLSLCQSGRANNVLKSAADRANMSFVSLNKFANPRWDVENEIGKSAVVVTLGRGALESMAMDKPVIIWDFRDYNGNKGDGVIDPINVDRIAAYNFSGRATGEAYTVAKLAEAFRRAIYAQEASGEWSRDWVLENANIEKQVSKYLSL